jgi:CHRD domain
VPRRQSKWSDSGARWTNFFRDTQEKTMKVVSAYRRTCGALGVLTATALLLVTVSAAAKDVKVSLTGAEETPPVTTSATGAGTIKINKDMSVSGTIKTTGIEGTAAHIHVGAPGQAGPPIITLTQGPSGTWTVPAGSKLTDEQYASFKSGNLYVNVHSEQHKPGEIRAQLKP